MNSPEPVAIIGMACRFAGGADSLAAFWNLLHEGRDAIGELPSGRWDWYASLGGDYAAAIRDVTKRGAFLEDVRGFDADFFDITPREAELMDPQQRMVLELAWEALEHAGIPPRSLGGSDTGVFMGVGCDDYGRRLLEDLPRIEAWSGIGGAYCGVPNRVSHVLDLRGPSVAVDTACSSSLVSIHLASQALRLGECPLALAGGVLVMASPGLSLVLDAAGATSPDGRCKSFDANADGYGRGEGGGVVVLKRLADARRDGDAVLAVVRGSAVHQDGHTNGIMAPNGDAQAHLMRRACLAAGISPHTVAYVEAHGTGTPAGDPLEVRAISEVYGRSSGGPVLIGSVKPNVGHLEAAAGVAGVIKTVLALRHEEIPPSLNFSTPNPVIPWESAGLQVVTEPTPWPSDDGTRLAGVSGYGYGGTIAHVILEEGDLVPEPDTRGDLPGLYPLSGASQAAVSQYAGRLADRLAAGDVGAVDLGHTLAHRRSHLTHRAAVYGADRAQLVARLRDLAATSTGASTVLPAAGRGTVWVFSGHGSQWVGMGRGLLAEEPVFAEVIARLEPLFTEEIGMSPGAVILADTPQPVDVIQPMIFAIQVALAAVWRSHGLSPAAVIGHSVGEIAAAVTAGILTLEQGARLVCRRSVLLRSTAGRGAMAMVSLSAEEAERRLGDRCDVSVAVAAALGSAVLSGDRAAVEEICGVWQAEGIGVLKVDSDVAFHSPHMDRLLDALATAAADLPPSAPAIPVYSTALADPRDGAPRDGGYWAANLRGQVKFVQAVTASVEDGYRLFLEVSPHPVVQHSIEDILGELDVEDAFVTHSLRRGKPERETLVTNLGALWSHGAELDWTSVWPGGSLADLPTTQWRHRPHWAPEPDTRAVEAQWHDPASHTLLGRRIMVNGTTSAEAWLTRIDRDLRPYPGDHPVRGVEIIPAAVLLNTLLTAAASDAPADLADVALRVPVSLTSPRDLQVVLQDGTVRLSSRIANAEGDDNGWITNTIAAAEPHSGDSLGLRQQDILAEEELPSGFVTDRLGSLGVGAMGFPWALESVRRGADALVVTVRADPGSDSAPATWAPLLDAAMSAASVAFSGPPILRMPAAVKRVTLVADSPALATVTVFVTGEDIVDVEIADPSGSVVGRLLGLRYAVLDSDVGVVTNPHRLVHRMAWRPVPSRVAATEPNVVLVGPDTVLVGRLTERLGAAGVPHRIAATPDDLSDAELTSDHTILVVPPLGPSGGPSGGPSVGPSGGPSVGPAQVAIDGSWLLARCAQRLAESGDGPYASLWCVTWGVRESVDERALGHGPLWGLGRVIGGEHPEFWGGVIDIGWSPQDVPGLIDVLRTVRGEDVVVIRDGQALVPRLHRLEGGSIRPAMTCRPDGTYLITGGLGVLGLEVAQWLAARGGRRIVLAGRRALPPRDAWDELTDPTERAQVAAIRSLELLGVTVVTVALDIADAEAAAKLLAPAALGLPQISGVVHLAGVLDNRTLRTLDEESLRTVMRPKVNGALVLHSLFPAGSVDFFVMFSSSGQLLGLPGQASYAAGNAFLDALAAHRRAAGDTVTASYGWTSWRGLGMSTSSGIIDEELAARGTADISLTEAFGAWELADRHDVGYAAILRTIPWEPGMRRLPLLSELPADATEAPPEPQASPWLGLEEPELRDWLVEEISRQVAVETRLAAAEVDPRRPLIEMGVDSVMTVRIRRGLERRFRLSLPTTLFWDRPTIDAVAELLAQTIGETAPAR